MNDMSQYMMHMRFNSAMQGDIHLVLSPIEPGKPDIHIEAFQNLYIGIERRTRSVAIMLSNTEKEKRKTFLIGEKDISLLILNLQGALCELRKIPLPEGEDS